MIVCHCKGTTDRQIRAAANPGVRDWAEVGRRCGAGLACGGCRPLIREILAHLDRSPRAGASARELKR